MRLYLVFGILLTAALTILACGDDDDSAASAAAQPSRGADPTTAVIDPGDGGNYVADLDPSDFVAEIDNPYLPWLPGSRWVYESTDGVERIEVEVLSETREIAGIQATVVRDRVWEEGELVEDTYDWYAQDRDVNVWYMGEDSTEFEDGEPVGTAGSWEASVDGALAGVIMWAEPELGRAYRQEYYRGEAEDMAEIIDVDGSELVAAGDFEGLIVIREWTPLEPEVIENKYVSLGVGVVLEQKVAGEEGLVELVSYTPAN